jgi:hypothetical protein
MSLLLLPLILYSRREHEVKTFASTGDRKGSAKDVPLRVYYDSAGIGPIKVLYCRNKACLVPTIRTFYDCDSCGITGGTPNFSWYPFTLGLALRNQTK